jgi:hypothetical protein
MGAYVRETSGVSRRYPDGTRRWRSRTIGMSAGWYLAGWLLWVALWAFVIGPLWLCGEFYVLLGSAVVAIARTAVRPYERLRMTRLGPFWVVTVDWPEPNQEEP